MPFLKFILYLYIFGLHLMLFLMCIEPEFAESINQQMFGSQEDSAFGDHYHQMIAFHNRVDKNTPDGAVVFIGDSITQGLAVSAVVPLAVNFGIGRDTTEGVLKRIDTLNSLRRSSAVVVTIGINDIEFRSNQDVVISYRKILRVMANNPRVLVNSIFPVDEGIRGIAGFNARIERVNQQILIACSEHENCSFLDVGPKMLNDVGQLDPHYHIGDGLHLSPKGYDLWIRELQSVILPILKR